MNLEEKLEPLVLKAIEAIEQTGDFVIEQAPLVLQEFLMWRTVKDIFLLLLFILILISPILVKKMLPKADKNELRTGKFLGKVVSADSWGFGFFISVFTTIIGIIGTVHYGLDLIKVTIAPKIYLIEYFTNL